MSNSSVVQTESELIQSRDSEKNSNDVEEVTYNIDNTYNQGYSYVILLSVFLISFCSWGNNASFSIYLAHYTKYDTYDGGSKLGYAALGGLSVGVGFMLSPIINIVIGKIGIIGILWVGNILQTLGLVLTSISSHHQIWQLYVCQGILQSIGLACLGLPSFTILPHWFRNDEKRKFLSTAQGIFMSATGFGGLTYVLGMQKVIEIDGVRWGLRAQAIINFGLLSVAILLMKVKSAQKVKKLSQLINMDILKSSSFYLSLLYICSGIFGYCVCLYSMDSYVISMGFSDNQGSIASAILLVGTALGRPAMGYICDQIGPINTSIICYIITIIFIYGMWIPARTYATILVLCFILGFLIGTVLITMVVVQLRLLGGQLQRLNTFFLMTLFPFGMVAIVATLIAFSATKDHASPTQFLYCIVIIGCMFIISIIDLIILRGYIISKDQLVGDAELEQDEYLKTSVPIKLWVKNIFTLRHNKRL